MCVSSDHGWRQLWTFPEVVIVFPHARPYVMLRLYSARPSLSRGLRFVCVAVAFGLGAGPVLGTVVCQRGCRNARFVAPTPTDMYEYGE